MKHRGQQGRYGTKAALEGEKLMEQLKVKLKHNTQLCRGQGALVTMATQSSAISGHEITDNWLHM